MREGDKLLNNSEYFQITGLTRLQKLADTIVTNNDNDNEDEEDENVVEELISPRFRVRKLSTASLMTRKMMEIRFLLKLTLFNSNWRLVSIIINCIG